MHVNLVSRCVKVDLLATWRWLVGSLTIQFQGVIPLHTTLAEPEPGVLF